MVTSEPAPGVAAGPDVSSGSSVEMANTTANIAHAATAAPIATEHTQESSRGRGSFAKRHRSALVSIGVVATLVAGVALGMQLKPTLGVGVGPSAIGPSSSPTPMPGTESGLPDAYDRVFARNQLMSDMPPLLLSDTFDLESFRYLKPISSDQLYAVRTPAGLVCLLAVLVLPTSWGGSFDGTYSASCQFPHDIPEAGLRLIWQSTSYDKDGARVVSEYDVTWRTDGVIAPNVMPRYVSPPASFEVPPDSPDQSIRLVYLQPDFVTTASGTFPDGTVGYSVMANCESDVPGTIIGYELSPVSDPSTQVVSADIECGVPRTDVAYVENLSNELQLTLTGDLRSVHRAYGIVTPEFEEDGVSFFEGDLGFDDAEG